MARTLLDAVAEDAYRPNVPPSSADRPLRLAVVDPAYSGIGNPKVTFEGESTMTVKGYPFLEATPVAGSRVVLAPVGRGYVILGATGLTGAYAALAARATALETRATALEAQSLRGTVPSSVVVGSGSASAASSGVVTFTGVTTCSLLSVFDGQGADLHKVYVDVSAISGTVTGIVFRLRVGGADSTTLYNYAYNIKTDFGTSFASNGSTGFSGFMFTVPNSAASFQHAHSEFLISRPNKAAVTHAMGWALQRQSGQYFWQEGSENTAATAYPDLSLVVLGGGNATGYIRVVKIA